MEGISSIRERFKFSRYPIRIGEIPSDSFPLVVKVVKCEPTEYETDIKHGEILRIDSDGFERRVLARDSTKRLWSFPVHTGAKFDIKEKKKEKVKSMYMREIVEAPKLPKKFRFTNYDPTLIRISGEEPGQRSSPLVEGDFTIKEVTRVRYFKTNRISDDEVDPKVVILPTNLDLSVTIATGLIGLPSTALKAYMDELTSEIKCWVNFDLYRGSSDILVYDLTPKLKRMSKKSPTKVLEHVSPKTVRIGTMLHERRTSRDVRQPDPPKQPDSLRGKPPSTVDEEIINGSAMAYMMSASKVETTSEGTETQSYTLQWLAKLETGDLSSAATAPPGADDMTEEELRAVARHRMRLLASLDDYGYGDDKGTADADNDHEESKETGDENNQTGDNSQEARGENESADGKRTEIPIDVDQTDGHDKIIRPGKSRQRTTQRRMCMSAAEGLGDKSSGSPRPQSKLVPIEFSETNDVTVTDTRWVENGERKLLYVETSHRHTTKVYEQTRTGRNHDSETSNFKSYHRKHSPRSDVKRTRPKSESSLRFPNYRESSHKRFDTIEDFPSDLHGLTVDHICRALNLLGLSKHEDMFKQNAINGDKVYNLSVDKMERQMDMSSLDAIKMYRFVNSNWRLK